MLKIKFSFSKKGLILNTLAAGDFDMKDGVTGIEKKFLPMWNMKIFKLLKNLLAEKQ